MKFYITTSIPYLNGPPHLGHTLEFVQTDAIARYERLQGKDVFFLTGSDEHGANIARSAEVAKKTPKEFVDSGVIFFANLLKKINISNDDFIRTSDKERHWPGAISLWEHLKTAGDLYTGPYRGLYCAGHEAFITEKDLVNGVCELHKKSPEEVYEENYFFKLSKYVPKIKEAIMRDTIKIFPEFRKTEVIHMLEESEDVSFSRPSKDLSWGIPVPGDDTQTMYVWCDALSNYISALGFGSHDRTAFDAYWPADMHLIGKDIIKFHAIFWPAMLMSAKLPLPKAIFVHGFINTKGEKMSKSTGNVADPFPLIEKYGADAVRFYLLSQVSTFHDSDFSEEHFHDVYEGVLVSGLGNLLSRTLKMMSGFGAISKPSPEKLLQYPFLKHIDSLEIEETAVSLAVDKIILPEYHACMERHELQEAINLAINLSKRLDEYIEKYKVYKLIKENPEGAVITLWNLAYALSSIAVMLKPFLPDTAEKILNALDADSALEKKWTKFTAKEVPHLFPRIEK